MLKLLKNLLKNLFLKWDIQVSHQGIGSNNNYNDAKEFYTSNSLIIKLVLIGCFLGYILADYFFKIDDQIQLLFFKNGAWLLIDEHDLWRRVFYNGIKDLIYIACGISLIYFFIRFKKLSSESKARFLLVFFCMSFIPLSAVMLKGLTRVDCPYDLQDYQILQPKIVKKKHRPTVNLDGTCHAFRPCQQPWQERKGRCFPAGHASGGFALISFRLLARRKKIYQRLTALGIFVGMIMGTYQMIRGAHFFGHTFTTMVISFMLVWTCEYFLQRRFKK